MNLEQRLFGEAERHYSEALEMFIEYDDRHNAGKTYLQLGELMHRADTGRYAESLDYYLNALPIFAEAGDGGHSAGIAVRNLAHLWHAWGDDAVVARTAEVMGQPPDAVRALFEQIPPEDPTAPDATATPPTID